ncbi:MAG: hypothetical protein ACI8TP_005186 [Acidimicrobiales bacterium]
MVEEGTGTLNGIETTRYAIEIDDNARAAFAALQTDSLVRFVEEVDEEVPADGSQPLNRSGFLDDADSLIIWLADDRIHQISVDSGSSQFTHTFLDLGQDIVVTPPN